MNETDESTAGTLPELQPDLEYIPVCSDLRGIYLSEMYEEDQDKQQPTLFEVMEKICRIVGCLTCGGMIYVLTRMAGTA